MRRRWMGISYGDSALFVRRTAYEALGGFRPLPILEDYECIRRLERHGRTRYVRHVAARTSTRRFAARPLHTLLVWTLVQGLYLLGAPPTASPASTPTCAEPAPGAPAGWRSVLSGRPPAGSLAGCRGPGPPWPPGSLMADYLTVLAVSLLPACGNVLGSLIAESTRAPRWVIGAALHAAAGVAIAVVSVELMPRILEKTAPWLLVVAFLCGAAFSVLLARGVARAQRRLGGASAGAWMVYMAVAADLLSDGLMTGVGTAVSRGLGLLLALSQVVANVPGGFAAVANFRAQGVSRARRLWIAASFTLPVLVGASAGFLLLRSLGEGLQHSALALVVGVLLLATVEDVVPEGDEPHPKRWISTASFAGGFAFFALLSSYVG